MSKLQILLYQHIDPSDWRESSKLDRFASTRMQGAQGIITKDRTSCIRQLHTVDAAIMQYTELEDAKLVRYDYARARPDPLKAIGNALERDSTLAIAKAHSIPHAYIMKQTMYRQSVVIPMAKGLRIAEFTVSDHDSVWERAYNFFTQQVPLTTLEEIRSLRLSKPKDAEKHEETQKKISELYKVLWGE